MHALGPTVIRLALMSVAGTLFGHLLLGLVMVLFGHSVAIGRAIQTVAGRRGASESAAVAFRLHIPRMVPPALAT